jgi:hypothetical protein
MKDSNMTPKRNVGAEKKLVALLEQDFADGPMNAAQAATGHWPAESTHKEKWAKPLTLRAGNSQHKHTVKTKIRNRDELCRGVGDTDSTPNPSSRRAHKKEKIVWQLRSGRCAHLGDGETQHGDKQKQRRSAV